MSETCCWVPEMADGTYNDADWIPHWSTELDAHREVAEMNREAREDDPDQVCNRYKVGRLTTPCLRVECDGCGDDDPSGEGYNHFDADYLAEFLNDVDWIEIPAGTGYLCDKCVAAHPEIEPAFVDGQELLAIDGVAL